MVSDPGQYTYSSYRHHALGEADALLEVWIDPGEPVAQVPDSLKMAGYGIEQLLDQGSYYALRVRNSQS